MPLSAPIKEPPAAIASCIHCGTPFTPTSRQTEFCCSGCEFVYRLIRKNGLEQFYDLKNGPTMPVRSLVFQKRDYGWLETLVQQCEAANTAAPSLQLELQGISCIGCVWLIEKLFTRKRGALSIRVDSNVGRMELRWTKGELDVVQFARELQSFGYLVGPAGKKIAPESRRLTLRIGICGALALNAMLFTLPRYLGMESSFEFAGLFDRLVLICSTLSLVIGGSYFISRAWKSLRQGVAHIDLPIALGLLAAYFGSLYASHAGNAGFVYFDFVAIFVFLMLSGRWLQLRAIERNRDLLLGLQSEPPSVLRDPNGERVPASDIVPGDTYSLHPGQPVPVRSQLVSEDATFGLEWINGESEAHVARQGRLVTSGAIYNGQTSAKLEALESWEDAALATLLRLAPRAPLRDTTLENFLRGYIAVVLCIAFGGFGAWWSVEGFLPALQVLISVLVVSCPCAAGVALPLADELTAAGLRRRGIYVREPTLWSRLRRVRKVLFDKTGTLTLETMALARPEVLRDLSRRHQRLLLAMVRDNLHPASCCLRESLMAMGVEPLPDTELVEEATGFGLELRTAEGTWRLGRTGWANVDGADDDCLFTLNGRTIAAFSFLEEVRADAATEVDALRRRELEIHILSGDRTDKVAAMARKLNLPVQQCRGAMSPEDKARVVETLDSDDTLMIGDGANDSLAFNVSYCTGTPAIDRGILEQKADFYFLGRGLNGVRELLGAAAVRRSTVRRVIGFAVLYNLAVVAISLAGKMNPLAAAVLMPLSSLASLAIVYSGCHFPLSVRRLKADGLASGRGR